MTIIEPTNGLPIIWRETADPQAYETARVGRVFNQRRPARYPVAVVEAETEDHIYEAVRIANERKLRISIRSGGHSWAAWSVRDDAVLIDLGKYKSIEVDQEKMVAYVSPSTTGKMLNAYLDERGLMFCGGHCPDVGLGGFLLQGGMGWNCRNWGWACEQIKAIDVVTADGRKLHCNETENSELLWCAKGAGPGFPAIITRFHLNIRKKIPYMRSSLFIYPVSKYREIMDWMLKITPTYDSDTEIVMVGATPPGMDQLCVLPLFVTFKKTEEEALAALKPANESRPEGAIMELVNQETSLAKEYRDQASANPQGHRYCADNAYINNEADIAVVMEKAYTTLPTAKTFALWYAMAPCSRRDMPDMALSMQSDHYFALYTIWEDEKDDENNMKWVRDIMKDMVPHCDGAYLGDSDFQVRQTSFWTEQKAQKLMHLRRKWNPENRICGYLDHGDASGMEGLMNIDKWCNGY